MNKPETHSISSVIETPDTPSATPVPYFNTARTSL